LTFYFFKYLARASSADVLQLIVVFSLKRSKVNCCLQRNFLWLTVSQVGEAGPAVCTDGDTVQPPPLFLLTLKLTPPKKAVNPPCCCNRGATIFSLTSKCRFQREDTFIHLKYARNLWLSDTENALLYNIRQCCPLFFLNLIAFPLVVLGCDGYSWRNANSQLQTIERRAVNKHVDTVGHLFLRS